MVTFGHLGILGDNGLGDREFPDEVHKMVKAFGTDAYTSFSSQFGLARRLLRPRSRGPRNRFAGYVYAEAVVARLPTLFAIGRIHLVPRRSWPSLRGRL